MLQIILAKIRCIFQKNTPYRAYYLQLLISKIYYNSVTISMLNIFYALKFDKNTSRVIF